MGLSLGGLRNGLQLNPFGGGEAFNPLSLGPVLWLKADAGLTLSTTPYAGTGTVTQVGTAITGVGTAFLSEVVVGDTLTGTLISGTVTVITSNTAITVDASNSGAGAAFTINPTAGVTDRVTTWADQSGQGYNATQATAIKKPILKSGANGINGKNVVRYIITNVSELATPSISHNIGTGDFWIAYVFRTPSFTPDYQGFSGNGAAAPGMYLRTGATNNPEIYWIADKQFITASLSTNTAYLLEFWRDAGVLYSAVNALQSVSTFAVATSMANAIHRIGQDGAAGYFGGDIAEMIFCNTLPAAPARTLYRAYVNTRWNLGF